MKKHDDIIDEQQMESNAATGQDEGEMEILDQEQDQLETATDGMEEQVEAEVEEEISPMQELELKLHETTNRMLRIQADYENLRRRTKQEKEADAKYRSQRLVEELLPALDNFDRALMTDTKTDEAKSLMQGLEIVHRQLRDALIKEGVETVETVGQSFDPHVHQAVMQVQVDDFESNIVVEELQKGYKLKDRVIRPAMVKVNE